jgi:hypothetical protein
VISRAISAPQTGRERPAIAGDKAIEHDAIAATAELANAVGKQQAFDPIDVGNLLRNEAASFSVRAAQVLFIAARHPHHRAHIALAAVPRHQHANELGRVKPIRLRTPSAAIHLDARGVEDVTCDPTLFQYTP